MPIEREFKYVLRDAEELHARLVRDTTLIGQVDILQGYLSRGGRIRSRKWWEKYGEAFYASPSISRIEYIFTYKHDLVNQPGCLEIETEISEADFKLGWSEADHKIKKTRFLLPSSECAGVWEVDFFRDEQGIYLAMAEFEVPAEAGPPDRLHPLVQEYLVFSVPEDDGRFKNRKLCERSLVDSLLKEIA